MNDKTHYEGGPAFPAKLTGPCEAFGLRADSNHVIEFHGMTLRDYFAAKAMEQVDWSNTGINAGAETCYEVADAMLKAREQ